MSRDRAWRRHTQERKLIKRLLKRCHSDHWWRGFTDVNGNVVNKRLITTYIGTKDYFDSKNISTTKWDSRYKCKYSPNRGIDYWRNDKPKGESYGAREKDKSQFYKILKENGIK